MGDQWDEQWDVVVVGSGPGGLTAAACLATQGRKVLVVERHDLAGGNAQVFRRHHQGAEYEFDVGIHYIGDCKDGGLFPSIFGALGVGDRLAWRPLDPDGFDTLHFPDLEVRVPVGWDEYQARLDEALPDDRAGIDRCVDVLRNVAEEGRNRVIPGVDTPTWDRWAFRPLSELFAECELSPRAEAVLDHWSGLYGGGPAQTAVAMHASIIDHYMRGAFYPEGGGQELPARLIQVIEAFGGEVRTLSPVREIVVRDRTVQGVVLEDGTEVAASLVISNADYTQTVRRLVDQSQWDPATLDWLDHATMTVGLVCVYVVVDIELSGPNTNYFVFPSYETDELYGRLYAGEGMDPDAMFAYVAMASRKDPGNAHLCPPGHTNFQVMTLAPAGYEYWGVEAGPTDGGEPYRRNEAYRARKQQLTDHLLAAAEQVLGPFRDHIVHVETATPLSHERYTHSTGGTSYGFVHSPDQTGDKRPQHKTEIAGLWVVGQNTTSGHGIAGAMVGGVTCAGEILSRPLLVEMVMGAPLADPAAIPPDPPGFDPMEWSRGARLRERRAAGRAARATSTPGS